MSKITPKPWRVGKGGCVVADSAEGIYIKGATDPRDVEYYGGNLICESVTNTNAQHIVKCVNSHDDLLEACEVALDQLDQVSDVTPDQEECILVAYKYLDKAVAKAKVKS